MFRQSLDQEQGVYQKQDCCSTGVWEEFDDLSVIVNVTFNVYLWGNKR